MNKNKPTKAEAAPPRRTFLMLLTALAGAAAAAAVAIPGVSYIAAAVRRNKVDWVSIGKVAIFPAGETRLAVIPADENKLGQPWDGMTAKTGVWVRNKGPDSKYQMQFQVFAINCTHLGCPVEWFPQSGLFMCPCHGGVYYENGDHASGPPPRGLYECVWKIESDELKIQMPHLPTLQNTLDGRKAALLSRRAPDCVAGCGGKVQHEANNRELT